MPKCPRKSRKVSKTRCFNDNDVVVHRTPGRCPRGSRKTSKNRCFDENDNELMFTPPGSPSPVHPGNLALQDPRQGINTIPPYMLNHIQRFMGPETTRGYLKPRTFAMLNQNIPSLGHMMFDFLYPGGKPRIKKNYLRHLRNNAEYVLYQNNMFILFKDYVRQTYIANKLKPIPLTPQEEQLYKAKLDRMIHLFSVGLPDRQETIRFLEDTTGTIRAPYNNIYYDYDMPIR